MYFWFRCFIDLWIFIISSLVIWCLEGNSNWCFDWYFNVEYWSLLLIFNIFFLFKNGFNLYIELKEFIFFKVSFLGFLWFVFWIVLIIGKKVDFCIYLMIWIFVCCNLLIDNLLWDDVLIGDEICKYFFFFKNFINFRS